MLIIVDGNAMGHAHNNATRLSVGKFQTQAIYGYARMLRDLAEKYKGAKILVLWDGKAKFRYDLLPEYKAQRAEALKVDPKKQADRDAYNAQIPYIRKMIEMTGISQMMNEDLEADDLAGYFVSEFAPSGREIILITGDGDWKQLVAPNVKWHDPRSEGKWVTHENFHESTGFFTTDEFLQGKALIGDTSDNIKGVDKIGKVYAVEILARFKSVEEFFRQVDTGELVPKLVIHKNLASEQGRAIYRRNMTLMDLKNAQKPQPSATKITPGKYNEQGLKAMFERLAFQSILGHWDIWVAPFKARSAQ